jgi:replicative DNA helicase
MENNFNIQNSENQTIQSQPHNRQAEEAVLGSVLINPESYYDVAQILEAGYFYIIRNRWIWDIFTKLHENRSPIDILTVSEELENRNQLEEIGGQAYLLMLVNQTPSSLNAEAYAKIVEETSVRRRMLASANEMAKLAYQQDKPIERIIDSAEKSVFNLSERRIRRDLQSIQTVVSQYYEPASGKTGFLLTVAKNAAMKHKKHVAMFSLEMSNEQLVQRMIAQETGINTQNLRSGKIGENQWDLFTKAIEVLGDAKIYLDDTPALTPIQMRTKCRRLHLEHHIDLVLVDYIQLMSSESRTDNRVQEVSYISRNLKTLARELNVPVLAAAQLSRAVEQRSDKKPILSDLRESGSLEQDADIVMFIHKKDGIASENDKTELVELVVAKHRNGPTRDIDLVFIKDLAQFYNAATIKP